MLRHDPLSHTGERLSAEPLYADPLYVTAALLARRDCSRSRIVYDLDVPAPPDLTQRGPLQSTPRSGRAERVTRAGETSAERAERERRQP